MTSKRSPLSYAYSLLSFIAVLLSKQQTWADLGDPCVGSPTVSRVGDMAILPETEDFERDRRAAVADKEYLWPEGKVYYTIDPAFSGELSRSSLSYIPNVVCKFIGSDP